MSEAAPPALTGEDVRERFNAIPSVLYYTRAAHSLGIWKSERLLIERHFPDRETPLVEAGCGAGRVTLALWRMGHRRITAFDFADELLDQARSLASEKGANAISFLCADATKVERAAFGLAEGESFGGALMMFNGLMQIPGRENRRAALRRLRDVCREGAPFLFTTHDRDRFREEAGSWWKSEDSRWACGRQDPRLSDFGDRHFEDESGEVFIHIPDRAEILADLSETGWAHRFDAMRSEISDETKAVAEFSDDCRFWVAGRA
ncbi:MAG TPA: class I SAM-dependent methyltransferase [Opitutaceae bacterium]